MSDKNKTQLNNDDLAQFKSLIGDTDSGSFSLDDILAEYGSGKNTGRGAVPLNAQHSEPESDAGPDLPWPEPPRTSRAKHQDNVVVFPGAQPEEEPVEEPDDELPIPEEASAEPDEPDADVIDFPEEESVLSAFIKDIGRKADDYADRMFEEDERIDPEQVRRLEKLIPGTDREEEPEEDERTFRRAKRQEPPPPDTPPQELAREYAKGLKGLRIRTLLVCFLGLLSLAQLVLTLLLPIWPAPLDDILVQRGIAAGLMGAGLLLSYDGLMTGIGRAFRGKVGMDTLMSLAALFTLLDGIMLIVRPDHTNRLPYTSAALVGLFTLLHGTYHKKCALRLACRTAAAAAEPYRVTLDEGRWNGRDTYTKWSGDNQSFGSQIQTDDGAQRIYQRFCPLLLLVGIALSLLISVGSGHSERLSWCLSALFLGCASLGAPLVYGRAFHKVTRRLAQSGATLAGWPGIAGSRRGDRVIITDTDLFPPGYVELNGYKVMRDFPTERVVAYTATLIRASGSGLTKLFHDELRALGGLMRNAERLCCYEGGGLSANVRGDQVLVGSAAFMNLMEIPLPQGLNVKSAVFCAINGELAGIFALNYTLPDTVFPALEELIESKVGPVLATRDFNLIPAMLHQRFKLAASRMDFPPVERRRELSAPDQTHSETLTALLCREGLYPFAEAVTAAKRLRLATRVGAVLCCVSSVLGLVLCAYLTYAGAYASLSPLSLLIFLLTWLAPVWFLSGWVHRF